MKKFVSPILLALTFLMVLFGGCAPISTPTPFPLIFTPLTISPTITTEPTQTVIFTPTKVSTPTPFPLTITPTFSPLILSTIPTGCNEIIGYGWLGAGYPDRCFALKYKPECPNIEIDIKYCQCNDFFGLTGNVGKGNFCKTLGYPNPPAPLILKTP